MPSHRNEKPTPRGLDSASINILRALCLSFPETIARDEALTAVSMDYI